MSVLTPQAEQELSIVAEVFGTFDVEVSESAIIIALARIVRATFDSSNTLNNHDDLTDAEQQTLQRGGFDLTPRVFSASDPFFRGTVSYLSILATSLTTKAAAAFLGVNESRIRQRCGEEQRTLYGVKGRRGWRLPRFQFSDHGEVPHIDRVLPQLRTGLDLVSVDRWFNLPNGELRDEESREVSPYKWLISGRDYEPVAELAMEL